MFHLRLFRDDYDANADVKSEHPVPHSYIYVLRGDGTLDGRPLATDEAGYAVDYAPVHAGPEGAVIWR